MSGNDLRRDLIVNEDILKWCEEYTGEPFHAVFCDPPYELGFMGKSWDSTGIAFDKETWRAISRHLYPGAYLLAFGGTRTFHRIAVAIEDAGFEIRDTVMWVYGSGFPKSLDVSKAIDKAAGAERHDILEEKPKEMDNQIYGKGLGVGILERRPATEEAKRWNGYGTALKPSWEPIIIARKPLEGTVAQNALKYGSGALNIDGSRVGTEDNLNGGAYAESGTERNDGWGMQRGEAGAYKQPTGRWPANLIHDGSDEVVGMFPSNRKGFSGGGGPTRFANAQGGEKLDTYNYYSDSGSAARFFKECEFTNDLYDNHGISEIGYTTGAARFFYSAKVSKRERDAGLEGFEETADTAKGNGLARICETCGASQLKPELCQCETKSWVLPKQKNHHPTLKPISLTTYLAKLILPPKLDKPRRLLVPFAGSGSEVIGGYLAGWDEVIGVEREKEYAEIAEARIKHWTKSSPQSSSSSTSVPPESTDSQEILDI